MHGSLRRVLCLALFATLFSAAQVAGAQTLTWSETLRRAGVYAPDAITATQQVRAARADAAGAGRWPRSNPVVRFTGDRELDTVPSYTYGGGLEQSFDLAGVAIARGRQAAASVRVAGHQSATTRLDALRESADAFIALDEAQRVYVIREALSAMYEQLTQASARTEAAGITPRQQTLLAMIEQSTIVGDRNQAAADRARARATLAVLVGLTDATELSVASEDDLPAPPPGGVDALVAFALDHRPELPAFRAQRVEADRRALAAALELVPAPTVFFGARSERFIIDPDEVLPNASGFVGIGGADHRSIMLAADLSFALPLFDRNQAERARASADQATARENLVIAERRIRTEVAAAFAGRTASWGTYQQWRSMTAALDEATLYARRGYESGQVGITETLVALERVARGRLALVRSRAEYWRARVALGRALGAIT